MLTIIERVKKLLGVTVSLLLAACGGGGGGSVEEPAVTAAAAPEMQSPVKFWQSYRESPPGVHFWTESDVPFTVERLPAVGPNFRSGYAYVKGGELVMMDNANPQEFLLKGGAFITRAKDYAKPTFTGTTHSFSWNEPDSTVEACSGGGCVAVPIQAATFPYVYAEKSGAVLVTTNYGEALLFRDGAWCRMTRTGDTYRCSEPQPAMQAVPTRVQFYAATEYRGRTLVGEWPTGRLYEFNGSELFPSSMSPPKFAAGDPVGYEAQSIAEYCGDLFVGYWPKGEIYRFDHKTGRWELFRRLFDGYAGEPFIPHSERPADAQDRSFYGQRVTALVPFEDSLYAVTSNLGAWTTAVPEAGALTQAKREQYGAVYRIKRPGCRTQYQ